MRGSTPPVRRPRRRARTCSEGQSFTNLFNSFPHHFLAPGAGRRSLPLSLCAVFAALAGRLGLTAHALDVPMRVIARVDSPGHTPVLVDVYAGSVMPPAVLAPEALAPLSPEAASPGSLVLRATRNISHSIGMMMQLGGQGVSPRALHAAHYASLSAACAVGGRAGRDLLEQLAWCVADAPLDARAVVRTLIAPRLVPAARAVLDARMDEFQAGEAGTVTHRAGMRRVRWWVGCWFRHRMFGYHAVVLGWTVRTPTTTVVRRDAHTFSSQPTCAETEQWIMQMHVDTLPNGGRHQPFYHIVDVDGSRRCACSVLHSSVDDALTSACRRCGLQHRARTRPHGRDGAGATRSVPRGRHGARGAQCAGAARPPALHPVGAEHGCVPGRRQCRCTVG
jgi:hemimethylated DNA binding protein